MEPHHYIKDAAPTLPIPWPPGGEPPELDLTDDSDRAGLVRYMASL